VHRSKTDKSKHASVFPFKTIVLVSFRSCIA